MFFADHEKQIYSPQGSDAKFDPLAVERALKIFTGNKLGLLIRQWKAATDGQGDINAADANEVLSAQAEGKLVEASRVAFGLPPFPESTDADALETLCDYLEWMELKGKRAASTPPLPAPSQASFPPVGTMNL